MHNQRTGITYPDTSTVSYTWNCCRITALSDGIGSSTLAYECRGGSQTRPIGRSMRRPYVRLTSLTDANSKQVQYTYTSVGRIQDVTDHTSAVTKYFYDSRGGLTKVTADYGTGNAKDTTYTLNANGAVTKQTLPSGHYNDYVYDDGGRVTSQTFKTSGGATVDSYSYNYSPTGLPSYTTGYTRTENNGDIYTFVFDRMGRMKQEKKVDSTPIVGADHCVCPRVDTTVDPYRRCNRPTGTTRLSTLDARRATHRVAPTFPLRLCGSTSPREPSPTPEVKYKVTRRQAGV